MIIDATCRGCGTESKHGSGKGFRLARVACPKCGERRLRGTVGIPRVKATCHACHATCSVPVPKGMKLRLLPCPKCGVPKLAGVNSAPAWIPPRPTATKANATECNPDWSGECSTCGSSPTVPATGLCGPCTFGEASTAGGNW